MSIDLTAPAFTAWLQSWDAEAIVGRAHCGGSCPLACFVNDQSGVSETFVSGDDLEYRARNGHIYSKNLPEWAIAFVDLVDSGYGVDPVTAATALDIMALITRLEGARNDRPH